MRTMTVNRSSPTRYASSMCLLLQELATAGMAGDSAAARICRIDHLAQQCTELAVMDFVFLYDPQADLLSIGYNINDRLSRSIVLWTCLPRKRGWPVSFLITREQLAAGSLVCSGATADCS